MAFKGPCLCGADDCPRCRPNNFRSGVYIGDCEDEDEASERVESAEDYKDRQGESRFEQRRDER